MTNSSQRHEHRICLALGWPKKIERIEVMCIPTGCVLCFLTYFSLSPLSFLSTSQKTCSLFTSTTWSWSAGRINLSMKATSSCLTRSWSQCGRPRTTAIAAATSLPSWSSKTLTLGSRSSSEQCPTPRGSFHLERQHLTSCEHIKAQTTQPFLQCTDTDWDSGFSTCEPVWILYSTFSIYSAFLGANRQLLFPLWHLMPLFCSLNHRFKYSEGSWLDSFTVLLF